jgi:hypothetical protein
MTKSSIFNIWLVDVQTLCAKYGLEKWFPPTDEIRKCLLEKTQFSTKNTFWDVNNKKSRKWCKLVLLYYLITITMAYLCSQWTPNFQIKYFMFDWSIYRLFVLNRAWKRDTLQIMTFAYLCSTWTLVERKTRSETCITRNDVNIISLFHISYLITLMGYL